jgi:hypothetical protein
VVWRDRVVLWAGGLVFEARRCFFVSQCGPLPQRTPSAATGLDAPRLCFLEPSGPTDWRNRMAFLFRLETPEGAPAEPPTLASAVPDWKAGDTIPLGGRTLRVVRIRDDDADQAPVLIVEEAS